MNITPESILVLGHADRDIDFTQVYTRLSQQAGFTVHALEKADIKKLPSTLTRLDYRKFDRVVIDLPFAKVRKHLSTLRKLPALVVFEEDACQNFLPQSRWCGSFEQHYQNLPRATIVLSGFATAKRFRQRGIDTRVIPKGFDASALRNTHAQRDLSVAFIGRISSDVYIGRRELLQTVEQNLPLQLLRTSSIDEYRDTLNRIEIFLSADVGLGEYMGKNFEAMGCGCLVVASRQGDDEEQALGLEDMNNIVLYSSAQEAIEKIRYLQSNPELIKQIAAAGEAHVHAHLTHEHIAEQLIAIAIEPIPTPPSPPPWWKRFGR